MNVNHFLQNYQKVPPLNPEVVANMFELRRATYRGFAEVEKTRGGIDPSAHLATSRGQEVARSIWARCIEELTESHESGEQTHQLEELIDASNYLWSLGVMDPTQFHRVSTACSRQVEYASQQGRILWGVSQPNNEYIGDFVLLGSQFLAKLRNRAWQNAPQSLYFDGTGELVDFISRATIMIMEVFPDWEVFYRLWMAKNDVLQYRLSTRY